MTQKTFSNIPIQTLAIFMKSNIPEDRLFYKNWVKEFLSLARRLLDISKDIELENEINCLEENIKNYKLYPKNNNGKNN